MAMIKKSVIAIEEDVRDEIFKSFTNVVIQLTKIGISADKTYGIKLRDLIDRFWQTRLEVSFDSAGPLGGAVVMLAPSGERLTVLEMDKAAAPKPFSFADSEIPGSLFCAVACIVRLLISLSFDQAKKHVSLVDKRLLSGSSCTLIFAIESTSEKWCSILLQDSKGLIEELLEIRSAPSKSRFLLADEI